jgi:hypothetical protein
MDLSEALAQTATDKGPSSYLEKYLADAEGTPQAEAVLRELAGSRQAAWVARAVTLLAQERGTIPKDASISGQSVTKWRAAHGS